MIRYYRTVSMNQTVTHAIRALPVALKPQAAPGTWECALMQLPATGSILNAGAGRGGISLLLDRSGLTVTSLDLHPDHFVAEGLTCEFADLTQPLAFVDDTYDAVIAVEVAEHLENPWLFLREAIRVLRPGGVLVFTSPNVVNLVCRFNFLVTGVLPYFREESFTGCYHVTPIFPWSVERWCGTTTAQLEFVSYSRVDWPTRKDIPKFYAGGFVRGLKDMLPLNSWTGEITCYTIRKIGTVRTNVGLHYA